nr:MAG TPA_asm: hypothetical protein [Caudoviricetes sp.]
MAHMILMTCLTLTSCWRSRQKTHGGCRTP